MLSHYSFSAMDISSTIVYRDTSVYLTNRISVCPSTDVCSGYLLTHLVTLWTKTLCWQQLVGGPAQLAVVFFF